MKVLIQSTSENRLIDITSMTAIGGTASSGITLDSLKYKDDYLVLSQQGKKINILPLKVKSKAPIVLSDLESFECRDLRITMLDIGSTIDKKTVDTDDLAKLLSTVEKISEANDRNDLFRVCLEYVISANDFDRGLIIGLNQNEEYEIVSHLGADPSSPWLSESLLQETLTSKTPLNISNIIGSAYEKNQSLMATGFMSVSTWPMLWRNKVIGAIVAGSGLPHSGVGEDKSKYIEILSRYIASDVTAYLTQKKLESKISKHHLIDNAPLTSADKNVHKMLSLAKKAARSDLNIYVSGETGTGKELLSKWIHKSSFDNKSPFIAVNCAAIPENLVESTLFGHKKGSFTGAVNDQVGKFVLAHGGTLFLDEIGELPLSAQGKLLRAIQEKKIEPVGASQAISIQTRIITASHKNLKEMVSRGEFREDLYYRLSEVELSIPSLRERPNDILLIAFEFLKENYPEVSFSEGAKTWLVEQKWSGNIRELLSTLKRAVLFCENNFIHEADFSIGMNSSVKEKTWLQGGSLEAAVKEFQQLKIQEALKRTQGNRTEASKLLGVTPRTLFRHLEQTKENHERLQ